MLSSLYTLTVSGLLTFVNQIVIAADEYGDKEKMMEIKKCENDIVCLLYLAFHAINNSSLMKG